ncbi:MAG: carbohydrate kinase [Luteitalea sp.]|nr:carbohydrate kinase [Luteitalea sp.]
MKRTLVVGELNVDLVLHGVNSYPTPGHEVFAESCALTLGSASAIFAVGLAKLGNPVSFVSTVGRDGWADYCLDILRQAGIDVSRITQDGSLQTGMTVSIPFDGDRTLVTFAGASRVQTDAGLGEEVLSQFAHLHVSSYFLQTGLRPCCARLFARASSLGLTSSLDPGFDPRERWGDDLVDLLRLTDIFLPNEVELAAVTGCRDHLEGLRKLDNGRTVTVVKLGAKGCLALSHGEPLHVPAFPIDAVDSTGAGDSFNAGFLHGWLRGRSLEECMRQGAACGALSTLGLGGVTSQPDASQLGDFLRASS